MGTARTRWCTRKTSTAYTNNVKTITCEKPLKKYTSPKLRTPLCSLKFPVGPYYPVYLRSIQLFINYSSFENYRNQFELVRVVQLM